MPAGFTTQSGFKREAITYSPTWPGTAIEVDALLPLLSEDVQTSLDQQLLVTRQSKSVPTRAKVTRQFSPGTIETYCSYEGSEQFFLFAMGQEAVRINGDPMPLELEAGISYRHLFEIDRDVNSSAWLAGDGFIAGPLPTGDGIIANQQKVRRGTFAAYKNGKVWETNSCMINSLTFAAQPQAVTLSADVVGYDTIYDSVTNANITSLSLNHRMVLFQEIELFVKPVIEGPIDEEVDKIDVSGMQWKIENNFNLITTRHTGTHVSEPQRGGACVVTGGFALPRWETLDFLGSNKANERLQIMMKATGPLIPGSALNYEMNFYFPNATITGAEVAALGPEQMIQNYSFLALSGTDPIGFPITTKQGPMSVEIVNGDGTHYLLD